jgi:SAM-dependent methyltransferase
MERDIDRYASSYSADYGFEAEMVHYRRAAGLERLTLHRPRRVIEVGCGLDPWVVAYARAGGTWDQWHVVEPAHIFADACRTGVREAGLANVTIHEAFFEAARLDRVDPDMIVCAGLLHEVPSSTDLLESLARAMRPGTVLHVSVPNANSFHRRLAQAMGLISNLTELSARNIKLDQRRVFDLDELAAQIRGAGLRVTETGGLLVKPFTHAQMESLGPILSRQMLDGLDALARTHPDWGSEIWAEAVLP